MNIVQLFGQFFTVLVVDSALMSATSFTNVDFACSAAAAHSLSIDLISARTFDSDATADIKLIYDKNLTDLRFYLKLSNNKYQMIIFREKVNYEVTKLDK